LNANDANLFGKNTKARLILGVRFAILPNGISLNGLWGLLIIEEPWFSEVNSTVGMRVCWGRSG